MWDLQQPLARVGCAIQDRGQSQQRHQCWQASSGPPSFSDRATGHGLRVSGSSPLSHATTAFPTAIAMFPVGPSLTISSPSKGSLSDLNFCHRSLLSLLSHWVCAPPEGGRQGGGMNRTSAGQCRLLRRLAGRCFTKGGLVPSGLGSASPDSGGVLSIRTGILTAPRHFPHR